MNLILKYIYRINIAVIQGDYRRLQVVRQTELFRESYISVTLCMAIEKFAKVVFITQQLMTEAVSFNKSERIAPT